MYSNSIVESCFTHFTAVPIQCETWYATTCSSSALSVSQVIFPVEVGETKKKKSCFTYFCHNCGYINILRKSFPLRTFFSNILTKIFSRARLEVVEMLVPVALVQRAICVVWDGEVEERLIIGWMT